MRQCSDAGAQVFPPQPYFSGRYSNGRVWVEHVAGALKLPLVDYAAGGATSGAVPSSVPPPPLHVRACALLSSALSQRVLPHTCIIPFCLQQNSPPRVYKYPHLLHASYPKQMNRISV